MYFHFIPSQSWQQIITLKPKIPSWKTKLRHKDVKIVDDKNKTLTKLTCFGVSVMTSLRAWQPKNHGSTFGRGRAGHIPLLSCIQMSLPSRKSHTPTRAARWLCLAKGLDYEAVTVVYLVSSLRINGDIHQHPGTAWCLIKHRYRFTFTFWWPSWTINS
jgi:hypothetical protein